MDIFDRFGFRRELRQPSDGIKANFKLLFRIQSPNMFTKYVGKTSLFTDYPMEKIEIQFMDVNQLLPVIGGYWTSISGIGFIILNYFLYREFISAEAREIYNQKHLECADKKDNDKHDHDD